MQDRFGFKHSRGMLGLISARHAVDIKNIQSIDGKTYSDPEQVAPRFCRKWVTRLNIEVKNGSTVDSTDGQAIGGV
jgi:hypothetical protein